MDYRVWGIVQTTGQRITVTITAGNMVQAEQVAALQHDMVVEGAASIGLPMRGGDPGIPVRPSRSSLLSGLTVLALLVIVTGLVIFAGNVIVETNNRALKKPQAPSVPARPYPASVDARELMRVYFENGVRGDQLYRGKWLRVNGQIDRIGKDIRGTPYITMLTSHPIFQVQICFDSEVGLSALRHGEWHEIDAECEGELVGNVMLRHGELQN